MIKFYLRKLTIKLKNVFLGSFVKINQRFCYYLMEWMKWIPVNNRESLTLLKVKNSRVVMWYLLLVMRWEGKLGGTVTLCGRL